MNKAEKYIQDCTRNCSNALLYDEKEIIDYEPWLTPDDARKVAEITKEEMIEKVAKFLSKEENIPLWSDNSEDFGCDNLLLIKKLTQVMED